MFNFPSQKLLGVTNFILLVITVFTSIVWLYAIYRKPNIIGFWFISLAMPFYFAVGALNTIFVAFEPKDIFRYISPRIIFPAYTLAVLAAPFAEIFSLVGAILLIRHILKPKEAEQGAAHQRLSARDV
jgi:hypothetical protein